MASSKVPYFKSWLVFVVSSVLLSMGAGMAVGIVLGMVMGFAGVDVSAIRNSATALGFVIGLSISFVMFRWVIDRYIVPSLIESDDTNT